MRFDLWEAITFMLCLTQISLRKADNNYSAELHLPSFLTREKKRKQSSFFSVFCSLTSLSKTISVAGGKFGLLEHFTLQLYTLKLFFPPNTLGKITNKHTLLYKKIKTLKYI